MDPAFAKASLADMTRSCLEGARQSIQRLEGKDKIYMQTRLADLRLWADSVGATAQAKASLDQRFQHRPDDVYLIRGLLFMLQGFFSECSIAADNKSDIQDIISNVNSTIDSLAILGVQIRRSGRQSRLRKADSSFDKNREKYRKFRAHLACIIASKPTENGRPVNEGKEIHSVDYFANLKLTSIQERLIEANLRRRHRFLEAQRHSHGLKDISTKAYQPITPQQTIAEMPSSHTKQGANSTPAGNVAVTMQERQALPTNHRHNAPMTTVTSASGLDSKWGGLRDSRQTKSTVTRITTITAAAKYPKAHTPSEQKLIKCPCCCQAIPASEVEGSQWKKHLAKDINPYTCILENCPTPYNLFATHNEWKDHVMNDHPSQWHCPCCDGDATVFKSLSGVINHIMSKHPDAISESLEDLLLDAEIKVMGITECPLCDSEGPQDSPELVEHVLQHVHDFSLRSLPWPTDPPFSPSKPVATFDTDYATRLYKDDSGNEYSFSIAEWAESVAPKKGDSGDISVVDPEGNELFLDMTKYPENITPSDGPPLQLCHLDQNPPNISEIESTSITPFNVDYFSENIYFKEESSDSRSSSQSHQYLNAIVNNAFEEMDPDQAPTHLKKTGDDWFAIFNQHVPRVLDVELVHTLPHESTVRCVRFSPDGKYLATSCNDSAQIYDVSTGKNICVLQDGKINTTNELFFKSVCFSPDSKYLATIGEDKLIQVWDIATRTISNTLAGHEKTISSLDFARDGRTIASGSEDHTVRLWDIEYGTNILTLPIKHTVTTVAISPDTMYVAASSLDDRVRVWDIHQGYLLGHFDGHQGIVLSIAFSPGGEVLISSSSDGTIKMWKWSSSDSTAPYSERCIRTFEGHRSWVRSVAITPDANWVISGSSDGSVRFWDARTGSAQLLLELHRGPRRRSLELADSSPTGGFFATGSFDKTARIWSYSPLA
ncbi:WD40-repeat-containing domain protein [Xylaria scruposa]|nr:WD40-repeat-containing domain protein [Xylaria scruposa]